MFLFICNLGVALYLGFHVINSKLADRSRGTNAVSRFVRDAGANTAYIFAGGVAMAVTAGTLLMGLIFKCWYTCLPTAIVYIACIVLRVMSNKNKERAKDARFVTKGALQVSAQVSDKVGQGVGTAVGSYLEAHGAEGATQLGADIGKTLGAGACIASDAAANAMIDVADVRVNQQLIESKFKDPVRFLESAKRAGIDTEGKPLDVIAECVVRNASPAMLEQLPDGMCIEDKAMAVMNGVVVCEN